MTVEAITWFAVPSAILPSVQILLGTAVQLVSIQVELVEHLEEHATCERDERDGAADDGENHLSNVIKDAEHGARECQRKMACLALLSDAGPVACVLLA